MLRQLGLDRQIQAFFLAALSQFMTFCCSEPVRDRRFG
jgi:hypothetical protein